MPKLKDQELLDFMLWHLQKRLRVYRQLSGIEKQFERQAIIVWVQLCRSQRNKLK